MTCRSKIPTPRLAAAAVAAAAASALVTATLPLAAADASPAAPHGWRIIKVIGTRNVVLRAIAAPKASSAWLGGLRASSFETPVLYHLTGGRAPMTVPPGGRGVGVNSLSESSASNVWGSDLGAPDVLRLTKSGWSAHSVAIGKDDVEIAGVVATGQAGVWALTDDLTTGHGYAFHFDGKAWHKLVLPYAPDSDSQVGVVGGTSDKDIWSLTFAGKPSAPAAFRYNGKKWQLTRFPASAAKDAPLQILAESATNAWVTLGPTGATSRPLILLHWNGARWSRVTGKLPADTLLGPVAPDGRGGLWLPAADGVHEVLLHFASGRWSSVRVPASHGKLPDVTALALVPGTRTLLGTGPLAYGPGGDSGTAVLEYTP
jgi:hypothetical protein